MYLLKYLCLLITLINTSANEISPRIYGGVDLRWNLHKHLVKLIKYRDSKSISICSGSILSPQWLISSAHCFPDEVMFVEVCKPGPVSFPCIATLKKSQIFIYPGYIQEGEALTNYEKDLALLKTTKRIKFSDNIQPIKLVRNPVSVGLAVTIAGYGIAEPGLSKPREGNAVVTKCRFKVSTTLICTHGSVRAASGDSGGPLISEEGLVGVTSSSCLDAEMNNYCVTAYVDVFLNLDWIENVILEN